jgi:hypothetical protein
VYYSVEHLCIAHKKVKNAFQVYDWVKIIGQQKVNEHSILLPHKRSRIVAQKVQKSKNAHPTVNSDPKSN